MFGLVMNRFHQGRREGQLCQRGALRERGRADPAGGGQMERTGFYPAGQSRGLTWLCCVLDKPI